MPTPKAHKLGPGSLALGETGTSVEFAVALRSCTVEPETDEGDSLPVLSGDEFDEGDEDSFTLSGTLLENYDLDSVQVWAHLNRGTKVPFLFRPDNDKALGIKGEVKVRRIAFGGDVKERNEVDFEFPGVGDYDLVDDEGVVITTYDGGTTPDPVEDDSPEWD